MKFNREVLLDKPVAIKITSEKQFKAVLDWCRVEFDYPDIDTHYNSYEGEEAYIGIKRDQWVWGVLGKRKEISFEDALLKEEQIEYKDITTDWSLKDLLELDLSRVEICDSDGNWAPTVCTLNCNIIDNLGYNMKYRYYLCQLEDMVMTIKAYQKLTDRSMPKPSVGDELFWEGRKVRIIK